MCISRQREGLGIENEGNEQSSCSPGQAQLPGVTTCWEHKGSSSAQHKLPALPVPGMLHIPSLSHQSLQFPHTASGGSRRHGLHWQTLNPHPGCSMTTSGRNPATSSASQTFSLAWQSPELGKLLSQAHTNMTSAQRLNLSQPRDKPKPSRFYQPLNPAHWLHEHSLSHCPTFGKVCLTWKHLGNIHSIL